MTSRVADILETFAGHRDSLSLSEVARRTGLPLTTTHRLVGELVGRHFLERDESGRYQIGLRLWELASHAPRSVGLRESALPIMEDLYEATHENVQLAIIDGMDAVYVERIAGRDSVQVLTRPGFGSPFTRPPSGWCSRARPTGDAGRSVEFAARALHPLHDHGSTPVATGSRTRCGKSAMRSAIDKSRRSRRRSPHPSETVQAPSSQRSLLSSRRGTTSRPSMCRQ